MKKYKWLICCITAIFIVISWLVYQKNTNNTYDERSIILKEHKDIPLFKGLRQSKKQYIMNGNHWIDIYDFYSKELPKLSWKLQHQSSALNDNDPKNDWTEATEYGTESKVIKFGTLDIKVLFEADNEIYLQSEKGIKLLKPEPAFLEYLNSTE